MARKYKIGDRVIVKCLRQDIDTYDRKILTHHALGKTGTVIAYYVSEGHIYLGKYYCQIDITDTGHWWAEDCFEPGIYNPDLKCRMCNVSAPHADSKPLAYVCDFCRAICDLDDIKNVPAPEPSSKDKRECVYAIEYSMRNEHSITWYPAGTYVGTYKSSIRHAINLSDGEKKYRATFRSVCR